MRSDSMEAVDTINWHLAICVLIVLSLIFLCSFKSIKTSGKVSKRPL